MAQSHRVIITGAGHSGTNLVLETLRAANFYRFIPDDGIHTEDRQIHLRMKYALPSNYGTKLCTENTMISEEFFDSLFQKYPNTQIVFCLRSPIDTALARISKFDGEKGYDAKGNIKHLEHTADMLDHLWVNYMDNLHLVFMPQLMENYEGTLRHLISSLGLSWNQEMALSYKNIRIADKQKKYKGKLDERQKNLLKYEKELFGNYWEHPKYKAYKDEILDYYKNRGEVWKHRPTHSFWSVLMET